VDVPRAPGDDGTVKLVRVYETIDAVRGMLVRGLLESDGIDVLSKGEWSGPYRMGPVILFVPSEDEDRARELIAASEAGSLSLASDELHANEVSRTD
jgi:hypothetical protein